MNDTLLNILVDSFPKMLLPGLAVTIPLTAISFFFAMIIAVPSLAFVAWYGFRGSRIGLEAS